MMSKMRFVHALILCGSLGAALNFAFLAPPAIMAQADLGSISGTIVDASGAVIARASVTVTNTSTGAVRTTMTNSTGGYSVSQLVPATYSVSVTAQGFARAEQTVAVTVGSMNTFNARLAVAGGKTEITVSADNFSGVQLEKPEVSAVIETEQIQALPTPDRNPYSLVAYSGNLSADPTAAARGVGFNISGARNTSVDILLDGVENTDLFAVGVGQSVPLDATSEIRIVTSNSGAEYGRGAGAVNVSTKSGTNQFHGSVYEYNRVSTLGSDGYNNNYLHAVTPSVPAKPRYTRNQFGYSIGGPVKKDKLFFFSSTEWTRIRSAANIVAIVPTTDLIGMSSSNMQSYFGTYGKLAHAINGAMYSGASSAVQADFSSDVTAIGLSQMGLPASTKVSGSCADPLIAAAPICTSNLFGQVTYQVPADSGGGTPVNQWISFNRADWTISPTMSLFGRYIQQSTVNPPGSNNASPYDGYNTPNTQYNKSLVISLSKAFATTLASNTKLLGSRLDNSQPLDSAPVSPTLYINSGGPITLGAGLINFPGYSQTSPGTAIPFGGPQNFIEVGEDVAWTKGKHQITFGGTFLNLKDNRAFGAYENAIDALVQSGTKNALLNFLSGSLQYVDFAINPNGVYPCYRDLATDAYIVTPSCEIQLPVSSPNFSRSNRYQDGAAYANDSFKVTPKLTLNLGVRWEIYGPQHSQKAAYDANFFPDYTQSDRWDQIRNGKILTRNQAPNGRLWNLNMKQWAPKVGFAWDPVGNGKTSVRGGYSISYERNFNNVTFNVIQNPPNYAVVSFVSTKNPYPISNANLGVFATGTGAQMLPNVTLRAVDPRIKPAYAGNWSLSVERQIGTSAVSLSYVGTRGIHNYSIANINREFDGLNYLGDPDPGFNLFNRNNMQYGNINWRGADGDSYYHGLTAELRSSNLRQTGLTVRADYTYSHSIDNTSSTFSDSANEAGGGTVLGYLDPWNPGLDRGSSDFDQRQRMAVAMFWEIPWGKTLSGAGRTFLGGWTASTTFSANTGTPFSEIDCWFGVTVCPRASFVTAPSRKATRGMTDISSIYGPNTYSYISLPTYFNPDGSYSGHYNEQVNPLVNEYYGGDELSINDYAAGSDTPICSGLHGVGCHFVPGMDGRNSFAGPGSWNQNLGIVKDFKFRERYDIQLKGEFINLFNHANTYLNLGYDSDVSSYTDVLAYKNGNRNTQLSLHIAF